MPHLVIDRDRRGYQRQTLWRICHHLRAPCPLRSLPMKGIHMNSNPSQDSVSENSDIEQILRASAEILRTTDFTDDLSNVSFLVRAMELTYEVDSNTRTVERSGDVATAMMILALELLGLTEDPNESARLLAEKADLQADEFASMSQPRVVPDEEFQEILETHAHCTMPLDEFFDLLNLPHDEMHTFIDDMIAIQDVHDISALTERNDSDGGII